MASSGQAQRQPSPEPLLFRKADAQAWARQIELQADRGDLAPKTTVLSQLTVGDLVRRYLNEVVPRKRSAKNEAAVVKAFLRHPLTQVALSKLTSARFAAYRDERLTVVKGATVRREFVILRHCFETAKGKWSIPIRSIRSKLSGFLLTLKRGIAVCMKTMVRSL